MQVKKRKVKKPFVRTAEEKRVRSSSLLQRVQMFHDAGVINAQKLVGARHHVDVKMFTLGTLFIHEKENRLVCGGAFWRMTAMT